MSAPQRRAAQGRPRGPLADTELNQGGKLLSIGELARLTGIRPSALRYYEEAGILAAPTRVHGRRRYTAAVIHRIGVIRFAQQAGFSLREIKILFDEYGSGTSFSTRWRTLARVKRCELEELAASVERMLHALELGSACDCARVEDCPLATTEARSPAGRRAKVERPR